MAPFETRYEVMQMHILNDGWRLKIVFEIKMFCVLRGAKIVPWNYMIICRWQQNIRHLFI